MNMDKQELFREFAETFLAEWKRLEKARVQVAPHEMVKKTMERVINPSPEEEFEFTTTTNSSTTQTIQPDFPRVLASTKTPEYVLINSWADWAPYHDWYTVFPPQQPASRPIETTLDAEVKKLVEQGFKERPKEAWERRKQKGPSNLWYEGRSF